MRRLTRTVAAATMATALALVSACSSGSDDADGNDVGSSLEQVTYLTSFGNFGRDAYAWVAKEKATSRTPASTSRSSRGRAPAP